MEDDASAAPAVQCSVIQYCPETAKVDQEVNVPKIINEESKENNSIKANPSQSNEILKNYVNSDIQCINNIELESKENLENCTVEGEISNNEETADIVKKEALDAVEVKLEPEDGIKESEDSLFQEKVSPREVTMKVEDEESDLNRPKSVGLVNGQINRNSPSPADELEDDIDSESDEEVVKPRRRGRCKKNPELIPPHLAPDIALGYRMLLKFLETPQFSGFLRPGQLTPAPSEDGPTGAEQVTCLNQIKKKFDENSYKRLADFVGDVRSMLSSVYMAPNPPAVKRALRLEQVLEQRIAQLPNYLRPDCALVLTPDEISNSPKKIRINKGGGFVSLLLERAEKIKAERDREKRKVLAEERKHLKEEQDKDVLEWEKNILLKDHEEEIKSMWELPQIGHFIHLCANILNIGDVSQYEVERMLLMPQCSETLDLLITALLSNSLVRAKLDRTPSMPYSVWFPLLKARVHAWYKAYQREYGNVQKVFDEMGVEPEFWQIVGTDHSPLDYFYFHEIPLLQRVWILKTLCDVDFVRKKTVYDNIRQQLLQELQGTNLGVDGKGNRYIHFPQFGMTALRIYRQATNFDNDIQPADLVESQEGFEERKGEITQDKVFRDIWDVGSKPEPGKRSAKKRGRKKPSQKDLSVKLKIDRNTPTSLRQSARAKRKVYVDTESDSDCSDTDLATLKNKLSDSPTKSGKTFISLSVFRLPRDKVKPVVKKSAYSRRLEREEAGRLLKMEEMEASKDKLSGDEESNGPRLDDDDDDEETKDNFTVKNLENLKMVLKKDHDEIDGAPKEETQFKYNTPVHLLPDSTKFYCVVDSVDSLRQLISKFASDENDLEIINRSTLRSGKKSKAPVSPSCEVQLIERLQKLEEDLEPWEMDYLKTSRSIREKLYKEHTSFLNRPSDFVHPNEAYWQKLYEEPPPPPPPAPPIVEPEPVTLTPAEGDLEPTPGPPSPLGGLRPRTRTRLQQQQHQMIKVQDDDLDDEDYEVESPESDDNWEMPARKKKRTVELRASVRQSKRPTKRPARMADFSGSDQEEDKSEKALFWSPRSSDPSEELNWETNRQKILEKHNPLLKKVLHGDIESEMSEVENALKNQTVPNLKKRVLPPPIPGNRKPYYSSAQLKAMANKNNSDVEIVNEQRTISKKVPRYSKSIAKKSAGTQSNEVIDVEDEPEKTQTQALPESDEYFITDGSIYIKIEYSFVQELMKNQQAVKKYKNQLDLNKKIQIVKKKDSSTTASAAKGAAMANNKLPNKVEAKTRFMTPEPKTNLRFIRPQNVTNQIHFLRPTQRLTTPNQTNFMYVQTSQPQSVVQLQSPVRAGLVQMVRPGQSAPPLVAIADKNTSGTLLTSPTIMQQQSQGDNNKIGYVEIIQPSSNANQVELIQVQSPGKPTQANTVLQSSTAALGTPNILRINTTAPSTIQAPSYVRLASTGQIVQIAPSIPSANLVKPQMVPSETSTSETVNNVQASPANQVTLIQVQGISGEPISYIPVQSSKLANYLQIQSPQKPISQLGTLVQVASPTRQPTPVGRIMQIQSPVRPQGVVLQQTPQPGTMVQMQVPRPVAAGSTIRPNMVQATSSATLQTAVPQNQLAPRQQTTLVQVYGSPRMQTTATQMQGSPRPQTIQLRTVQTSQPETKATKVYSVTDNFGSATESGALTEQSQEQLKQTITSAPQIIQTANGTGQMVMVQLSQPLQQGAPRPTVTYVSSSQIINQTPNIRQRMQSPRLPTGNVIQVQGTVRPVTNAGPTTAGPARQTLVPLSHPAQLQNNGRPTLVTLSQSANLLRPAGPQQSNATQTGSGIQMVPRSTIGSTTPVRPNIARAPGPVFRVSRPTVASNVVRASAQLTSPIRSPAVVQLLNQSPAATETTLPVKAGTVLSQHIAGQVINIASSGNQVLTSSSSQLQYQTSNTQQVRQMQNVGVSQAVRPPVRTQYVQVQGAAGKAFQFSIEQPGDFESSGSLRLLPGTNQLVRVVPCDQNAKQSQPILVKATGSRSSLAVNQPQPVTIKIDDDEDEDLQVVGQTVTIANDGLAQ